MNISKNKCLRTQQTEFIDMVSNVKVGDLFVRSFTSSIIFKYDGNGIPKTTLFYVDEVKPITTRFGSRDRIIKGRRCFLSDSDEYVIEMSEKESKWCSQLADTEKYDGTFKIVD